MRIAKRTFRFDERHQLLTTEEELLGRRRPVEVSDSGTGWSQARCLGTDPRASLQPVGSSGGSLGESSTDLPRAAAESLSGPLFVGELRIEGARGVLRVVDRGTLSISVDDRREGEEIIAELQRAANAAPVAILTCAGLYQLGLGGAPHDPLHQDPSEAFSCECVRRARVDARPSPGPGGPASCRILEDFTFGRVRFTVCCRCSASLTAAAVTAAVAATLGTDPGAAGAADHRSGGEHLLSCMGRPESPPAGAADFPCSAPASALPVQLAGLLPAAPDRPEGRWDGRESSSAVDGSPPTGRSGVPSVGAASLFSEEEE